MQCDALLRTMVINAPYISHTIVVWCASDRKFEEGYQKLVSAWNYRYEHVEFMRERDTFKESLCAATEGFCGDFMLGNSDDNLFINPVPVDTEFELADNEHAFSLRLNPCIDHCQPASLDIVPPPLMREGAWLVFDWTKADPRGCWGYPCPCDSNVYRRQWFREMIVTGDYKNPFTFENWMQHNRKPKDKLFVKCLAKSALVNVCNNRVQDTGNPCGGLSAASLNEKWLEGFEIDVGYFMGLRTEQCHIVQDFSFVEKEG